MSANYIVRLDDACPTMNIKKWDKIEKILDMYNIKPIVAVIPNNKDYEQKIMDEDLNFWEKVRKWEKKGWHIALHGYDHVYITNDSGLVPFNNRSEFSGLGYNTQAEKIKKGIEIFQEKNISTYLWVAPSHTFDKITLESLKNNSNITTISDGIGIYPFEKYGFKWIPQQFWSFRKMPFGLWTSCFHPNEMSEEEFNNLELFLKNNSKNFVDITKLKYKKFCLLNIIFSIVYWQIRKVKKWI